MTKIEETDAIIKGFEETVKGLEARVMQITQTLTQTNAGDAASIDDKISECVPQIQEAMDEIEKSLSVFKALSGQ